MLINTVTPHVANAVGVMIESMTLCCDRSCTCKKKRTKKLLQEDYEDVNTGSEFLLEARYSQFLTTTFMIFMYSSGLPLLYLIALVSFFFTYWFDKWFLLRWHRKPPAYTLHLSSKTRTIMKFALVPHFFVGLYMYSNSTIITPTEFQSTLYTYIDTNSAYLNSYRFANIHSAIFIAAFAFFLLLFVFRYTFFVTVQWMVRACKRLKAKFKLQISSGEPEEIISDDFYQELSAYQLCKEFNKTAQERSEMDKLIKVGNHRP
jgi:hypothetical protein